MIKLLIGGSPCTYWSIAQKKGRETKAEGIGWELFKNYLIAKEKFKPDFFLYENNRSAAQAIKDQIKEELNVYTMPLIQEDSGARYIEINSALVSAQNRQRFYVHNCGEVEQPSDRGILLQDILESGIANNEKSYCLTHVQGNVRDYFKKNHTNLAFESVRIGDIGSDAQAHRVYSSRGKSVTLTSGGGGVGAKTGLYMVPVCVSQRGRYTDTGKRSKKSNSPTEQFYEARTDGKSNALTTVQKDNFVAEPITKSDKVYEVKDGKITVNKRSYPIKLHDGYYIIRKLTVKESCRLQTMPDDYCRAVSNAQAYKGLGNGWTAEVIIHILNGALKGVPKDEEILVLSMYDGIGTGRYCLDKMGFTNVKYYAYEIDKYAMQVALSNYPDIIEMGDAFQVRERDWKL